MTSPPAPAPDPGHGGDGALPHPPRVRVRQDAPVELPHVMLLIDDPDRTVIEPLTAVSGEMEQLYDFDLQQGGGHLKGWKLTDAQMDAVADAWRLCARRRPWRKSTA